MLTSGGQATTGTIQHEGVRFDSNSMTDAQMREVLEIPAAEEAVSEPETPTENPQPEPTPEPDKAAKQAESHPQPKAKKNPQDRINALTREREDAKREAARVKEDSDRRIEALQKQWRDEFEALKRQTSPKPQEQPKSKADAGDDPEPKLEDFADQADPYAAWMRASAKWDARHEFKAQQEQSRKAYEQRQQQQRQFERDQHEHVRLRTFGERMNAAFQKNPELQALLESPSAPQLSRPMMDAIVDSEIPDQISQYLVEHPEEAARIVGLHPLQQFRAMSRLEYQLEQAANPTGSAPPAKTKTAAHPPVSPVSGSHAAPSSGEPGPDASYEEHKAYWNRIEREQRGRR